MVILKCKYITGKTYELICNEWFLRKIRSNMEIDKRFES